jgi:hypothetical protein
MNITMGGPGLVFSLVRRGAPVTWTPLSKDGYGLPPWQAAPRPARQVVGIGETYDFRVLAPDSASAALELRTGVGRLVASQEIRFVK